MLPVRQAQTIEFKEHLQMNADNTSSNQLAQGTDGTTLDIVINDDESLPKGLERLRSGVIVITQVFCPQGHNLIDPSSSARFNGYPGISLKIKGQNEDGIVIVSPIPGDDTRFGATKFAPGEQTEITCPVCNVKLPTIQSCGCTDTSSLIGLFLTEDLQEGNQVVLCNSWGCLRSKITDRFQIISKLD